MRVWVCDAPPKETPAIELAAVGSFVVGRGDPCGKRCAAGDVTFSSLRVAPEGGEAVTAALDDAVV